jgi:hypothetical protein
MPYRVVGDAEGRKFVACGYRKGQMERHSLK